MVLLLNGCELLLGSVSALSSPSIFRNIKFVLRKFFTSQIPPAQSLFLLDWLYSNTMFIGVAPPFLAHLPRTLGNESFQTVASCIITVLIGSVEMLKTSHINIYIF